MYIDRKAVKGKAVKPSFNDYEWALIERLCELKQMQPATLVHLLALEALENHMGELRSIHQKRA